MKQFLLFAGQEDTSSKGVHGFVGDFDSFAEAFVFLIDHQTPSQWWHILDTTTGEVVERRHLKISNNMIGFQRSDWTIGQASLQGAITPVSLPPAAPLPTAPNLVRLEAELRSANTPGMKNGRQMEPPRLADHLKSAPLQVKQGT